MAYNLEHAFHWFRDRQARFPESKTADRAAAYQDAFNVPAHDWADLMKTARSAMETGPKLMPKVRKSRSRK